MLQNFTKNDRKFDLRAIFVYNRFVLVLMADKDTSLSGLLGFRYPERSE